MDPLAGGKGSEITTSTSIKSYYQPVQFLKKYEKNSFRLKKAYFKDSQHRKTLLKLTVGKYQIKPVMWTLVLKTS